MVWVWLRDARGPPMVGQELSPPAEPGDVRPNIHVSEKRIYNDLRLQANPAFQRSFWALLKYANNFLRRCKMKELSFCNYVSG